MIKIKVGIFKFISGFIIFLFIVKFIYLGPYISCQFLSFFCKINIVGNIEYKGWEDNKFIYHIENAVNPILIKFFELKFIFIPKIKPIKRDNKIIIFIIIGIKKIWDGDTIHISDAPIIIEKGDINIIGKFIKILFEILISGLVL